MSEMAKKARAAMKEKAQGRAAPTKGSIDASGWTEPTMNTTAKTGMRPISRRAFKKGGKVEGEHGVKHAGKRPRKNLGGQSATPEFGPDDAKRMASEAALRKIIGDDADANTPRPMPRIKRSGDDGLYLPEKSPYIRKSGGRAKRKDGGKALTADSLINRNVKEANEERGNPHVGGYKKGGMAAGGYKKGGKVHEDEAMDKKLIKAEMAKHEKGCRCEKCWGGRTKKEGGGSALDYLSPVAMAAKNPKMLSPLAMLMGKKKGGAAKGNYEGGTRPTGGRMARKSGGRAKKTNISIVVNAGEKHPDGMAPPMGGMIPPAPVRPPMPVSPLPAGGAGMPPAGAAPAGGGLPPGLGVPPPAMGPMARKSGGRAKKWGGGPLGNSGMVRNNFTNPAAAMGVGRPGGMTPPSAMGNMAPGTYSFGAPAGATGGTTGAMPPPSAIGNMASSYGVPDGYSGGAMGSMSAPQPTSTATAPTSAPPPPMVRKSGGRAGSGTYRSYKDMDAGAGGGLGRLEKTEIEKRKK